MIRLLILGTGGAVPTPDRAPAAFWLTVDGRSLLVDPGPGALVGLMKSPRGPGSLDGVDAILLTHFHLDHCADVAPLLFALHSVVLRSERPFQVIGPPGAAGYLDRLRDLYGSWLEPARRRLETLEIRPGESLKAAPDGTWRVSTEPAEGGIRAFAAAHGEDRFSAANLGFKIRDDAGRSLVLSGDTGPSDELVAAARGADALVVECSTPDASAVDGHMSPARVGALAAAARPGRVVLTHLYPAVARLDLPALIREHADVPVVVAADGDLIEVPQPAPSPATR